jgi:hypothetical protein
VPIACWNFVFLIGKRVKEERERERERERARERERESRKRKEIGIYREEIRIEFLTQLKCYTKFMH